ncbi:unnamed protein product [Paramecium pentaurelia]|uniref:Cyclic nucleotide-binding domain-containing protein n=1 Tax=Paramecium pentaurelia TaxID=43138 RepID=A0A8S1VAZ4_9CILI|nr:unnamed protein product [Paramecium pentaurelia]
MNQSSIILEDNKYNSAQQEEEERMLTAKACDLKKALIYRKFQQNERKEELEDINQLFDERQLNILNDLANDNGNYEEQNQIATIRQEVNKKLQTVMEHGLKRHSIYIMKKPIENKRIFNIEVFKPEDRFRIIWDLFTMLIIFFAILILPLDISFTIESQFFDHFNYASIAIFSFDILINFNTSYQQKGQYIIDRKLIAKHYLMAWFWIDLISTFPFDIIINASTEEIIQSDEIDETQAQNPQNQQQQSDQLANTFKLLRILKFFRFIKVIRLLRVLKLKKIFSKFEDYVDFSNSMISLYKVLKLTFIMLFVAHWLACIWHFIADQEDSADSHSWLRAQDLQDSDWYVKYIASVYWATATMTTVGYGDITPVTSVEKIFGIVVMLLACCIFAYIMNSIGGIFVSMDYNEKLIRQKMGQANQFLKSNDIPKDLQARVRKYLEYKYEKESTQVNEKEALDVLSYSLRVEVLAAVNTDLINNSKVFKQNKFEKELLLQLPFELEEQIFGPEECIFLEGDDPIEQENGQNIEDRCLYFLNKGQVMVCIQKTFTCLKTLDKGATFGELGFFSNKSRSASAYTLDFVYVQKLKKKKFTEILKKYQTQNQFFLMNKHIIELGEDYSPLGLPCFGCQQINHFSSTCPKLHFVTNNDRKQELIQELQQQQQKFTKEFKRHEKIRYNSRGCFSLTNEVANEIKQVYSAQEEGDEDRLIKLQQRNEEEPTQEGFEVMENQKEIKSQHQDEFERMYIMTAFFTQFNIDEIMKNYNERVDNILNLQQQAQEHSIRSQYHSIKTNTKKSRIRSMSAERAIYFEKLIEKYGGPSQFLEKLNQDN